MSLVPLSLSIRSRAFGADAVRKHYEAHYPASGLTIAIVGDIDPTAAIATIESSLKRRPSRAATTPTLPAPSPSAERERYAYLDQGRAHLVVGFPGAALSDNDRHALAVLAAVLGGQGGRLFTKLREERGLVYRVTAHSVEGVDPGSFAVVTSCSPANVGPAITAIQSEIGKLRDLPIHESELRRATTFLAGATAHSLERRGTLAAALAFAEAHGLGYKSVFASRAAIKKVTAADLQRVARRFFKWQSAVTSTVLPTASTPAVKKRSLGSRRKLGTQAARRGKRR